MMIMVIEIVLNSNVNIAVRDEMGEKGMNNNNNNNKQTLRIFEEFM